LITLRRKVAVNGRPHKVILKNKSLCSGKKSLRKRKELRLHTMAESRYKTSRECFFFQLYPAAKMINNGIYAMLASSGGMLLIFMINRA
jgi:hypothetical protein